MRSALLTLLEEKAFADIGIMDICSIAGVNRSTFYAHYGNTYDLLKEAREAMIQNFINECDFGKPLDISDIRSLSIDDLNFITPEYLLPYLRYIRAHKRLFKIYADNAPIFAINETDDLMLENVFVPILAKYGVTDKKRVTYMQKYYLKGIDAIITEWVQNDCEDDIAFICEIIVYCVRPTAKA